MKRRAPRLLLLLLACVAVAAAEGDAGGGGGDGDATATARSGLQATTPEWLAARSLKQFRINGDTWHRIAVSAGEASPDEEVASSSQQQQQQRDSAPYYYYNERTRATAWQLPRHHPRGTPLWALKGGDSDNRLGPPLFDLSALSFPDCAADWATILLPAAMFAAAKHAGAAWRAMKGSARDAPPPPRPLRGPSGAASKAD